MLLGKPLVFGAIFKFEGQLSVFNYQNGPTYRCLYPDPPAPDDMPSCTDIGVLGVLPDIVGTLQANEVLKIILELDDVLRGRLLLFDALRISFQTLTFRAVAANQHLAGLLPDYEHFCGLSAAIPEISAAELKRKLQTGQPLQLLDVREPAEYAQRNIGGRLIPLTTLLTQLPERNLTVPIVVHCQAGPRSLQAAALLREHGFVDVASLRNGLLDF